MRVRRGLALAPLLAILGGPAAVAGSDPIALYKPAPTTPVETAGSGLEPLVKIELAVDARGRVTDVRVLSIEPSSELDPLFRRAAEQAFARWRFKAATDDAGVAVASTLQWSVRFPPEPDGSGRSELYVDLGDDPPDTEFRRAVLALPVERRQRLLRQGIATAERHFTGDARATAHGQGVTVVTDSPSDQAAEVLLRYVQATFYFLHEMLHGEIPSQPAFGPLHVYVYHRRAAYQGLAAEELGMEWTGGFYSPIGLLAFHLEHDLPEHLRSVLIHEATHAWVDRHLVAPRVALPRWLGEGFAEYMANSDVDRKGRLVPGGHRQLSTGFVMVQDGVARFETDTAIDAKTVKRAVRSGEALTVEEIVAARPLQFYGDRRHLFYTQSWMLVHLLRHGRDGWAEGAFPQFLLYVAEGYPAEEALRAAYGLAPAELEADYRAYVKRF